MTATFYRSHGKRILDLVLTVPLLLLLFPVALLVGGLVALFLGRPIWFVQARPGYHGEPFRLIKFRTMTGATEDDSDLRHDSERLTRFGRLLRSTSLDEIPELIHVLKGEMSLVGPRPLLMQYLSRYTPRQQRRHEVRPGVTGWAQVNGRNRIPWDERFEMDVWYVDNLSFWLDLRILLRTLGTTLKREGISAPGQPTVTEYFGSGNHPADLD